MEKIKKTKAPKKEVAEAKESKVVAPAKMKSAKGPALKIIIRPLVTEKAANHQTTESTYSFVVAKDANKIEISKAVMELYGVEPVSVRTANVQGRAVRFGQGFGKRGDFKKAMVTLKKGDSITIHEGV
jgi:large subunit ribosomal protein L23